MKPTFRPLYKQVKESLLRRIASGEWTPGTFLPSEPALAKDYGVSHGTLRKALNELTAEHRVVRYQGKGTAVATFEVDETMFRYFRIQDAQGNRTLPTSKTYSSQLGEADEEEAKIFGIPVGSPVFHVDRVRFLNHTPVLNEFITLNSAIIPGITSLAELRILPNTLYNLLQSRFSITIAKATEQITADSARESDVLRLNVDPGTPLLSILRVAYDIEERPVELRHTRCVTNGFHYYTELA